MDSSSDLMDSYSDLIDSSSDFMEYPPVIKHGNGKSPMYRWIVQYCWMDNSKARAIATNNFQNLIFQPLLILN